jgi:hypothetical protein
MPKKDDLLHREGRAEIEISIIFSFKERFFDYCTVRSSKTKLNLPLISNRHVPQQW